LTLLVVGGSFLAWKYWVKPAVEVEKQTEGKDSVFSNVSTQPETEISFNKEEERRMENEIRAKVKMEEEIRAKIKREQE